MLPAGPESIGELDQLCRSRFGWLLQIVEIQWVTLDGIDCIWILKTTPPGLRTPLYFGDLIIPFADFSFTFTISGAVDGPEALSRFRHEFAWLSRPLPLDNRAAGQARPELPRDAS